MAYASARVFKDENQFRVAKDRAIGALPNAQGDIACLYILPRDKTHGTAITPVVSRNLFSNDLVLHDQREGIIKAVVPAGDRPGSAIAASRVITNLIQHFGDDAPVMGCEVYKAPDRGYEETSNKAKTSAEAARNMGLMFFTNDEVTYPRRYSADPSNPNIETTISEEVKLALYLLSNAESVEPHYQLKVKPRKKRHEVGGAEVLLRMKDPEKEGYYNTGLITQFAASTGLLESLDNAIREKALEEIKEYQRAGVDILTSFNFSPRELNPRSAEMFAERVKKARIDPSQVGIEVLETKNGKKNGLGDLLDSLTNFYRHGFVDIAYDDALSGDGEHSNLYTLAEMPFTTIKLDRKHMLKLGDSNYRAIAEGIIHIARRLNPINPTKWGGIDKEIKRRVVAEGVPKEWLDWARKVDYVQSFELHRPEPIAMILKHIEESKKDKGFRFQELK